MCVCVLFSVWSGGKKCARKCNKCFDVHARQFGNRSNPLDGCVFIWPFHTFLVISFNCYSYKMVLFLVFIHRNKYTVKCSHNNHRNKSKHLFVCFLLCFVKRLLLCLHRFVFNISTYYIGLNKEWISNSSRCQFDSAWMRCRMQKSVPLGNRKKIIKLNGFVFFKAVKLKSDSIASHGPTAERQKRGESGGREGVEIETQTNVKMQTETSVKTSAYSSGITRLVSIQYVLMAMETIMAIDPYGS